MEFLDMRETEFPDLGILGARRCALPGSPSEYKDIEQGIAHQPVSAVDSAGSFTGDKEVGDAALGIVTYLDPAILIMLRRLNQNGVFGHVYIAALILPCHRGQVLLDRARPVLGLDKR